MRRIEGVNAALLAVLPPAAWLLFSRHAALAVLVGGAIATLSFQFLKWQLRRALTRPGRLPTKGRLFVSYYLRFLGMLFVVFLVTAYGWTEPVPLLVGLSVVMVSIVLVGGGELLAMMSKRGDD